MNTPGIIIRFCKCELRLEKNIECKAVPILFEQHRQHFEMLPYWNLEIISFICQHQSQEDN